MITADTLNHVVVLAAIMAPIVIIVMLFLLAMYLDKRGII